VGKSEFEQHESLHNFAQSDSLPTPEKGTFRTLSAPVIMQWELTSYCNERCIHCYNYWRADSSRGKLLVTPETLKVYDRASSEIIKNKVFNVTITGGEPLAVLKWSYPYLQRLTENHVGMSFNTNLTMLTKERAHLLKTLGVKSILTSLISANPQLNDQLANRPNTHRDVSRGIELALSEGFWVGVNMVVTKKNLHDIYATAEYVKGLGVKAFSATKASTPTNSHGFEEYALSPQELRTMIQELLRVRDNLNLDTDSLEFYPMCLFDAQQDRDFTANHLCNAGKTGCTIGFDGSVRPCSHASQIYGSIQDEEGLKKAWINLQPWRTEEYIPNECSGCFFKTQCRGGCRSEAFVVNGSLNAPDPYCNYNHVVLPKTTDKKVAVDPSVKFRFKPGIKIREENFGGILFASPAKWTSVTKELYNFFKIKNGEEFYLDELSNYLRLNNLEEVARTAEFLMQKSMLQERG
jgi:radical SAM protein with 4Fe4S-binding SPASM domain